MEYKSTLDYGSGLQFHEISDRTVTGIAAVFGNEDSVHDIVWPGAFKKTIQEQKGRIRHLWQHDMSQPPVARIIELAEVGKSELPSQILMQYPEAMGGLKVTREYLRTARGEEILEGLKHGAISEMSFGFDPLKFDFKESAAQQSSGSIGPLIRNLRELRLWDTSDVNWGANPATVALKMAIPFKATGKTHDDWKDATITDFTSEDWSSLPIHERQRISDHYTIMTAGITSPEGFRFLHHVPQSSGVGPANFRALSLAMIDLFKSTDLTEDARLQAYQHLANHFVEFGKAAPHYPVVQLAAACTAVSQLSDVKVGRVLSKRNLDRLKSALDVLSEILLAAEPIDEEEVEKSLQSLTDQLRRRTRVAEFEQFLTQNY